MIRIKRGTFGWFDGRRVIPKNVESGPFVADRDLEARLVAKGMAEYVGEAPAPAAPAVETSDPTPEPETATDAADKADLASMTKAELEELAKSYGIPVARKTKAQLVRAIEESEEPPSLSASEVE